MFLQAIKQHRLHIHPPLTQPLLFLLIITKESYPLKKNKLNKFSLRFDDDFFCLFRPESGRIKFRKFKTVRNVDDKNFILLGLYPLLRVAVNPSFFTTLVKVQNYPYLCNKKQKQI